MKMRTLLRLAGDLPPVSARRLVAKIADGRLGEHAEIEELGAAPETLSDLRKAAQAWESDVAPAVEAIVAALRAGDRAAMLGLRAILPTLLKEVNADPVLHDVMALQMGRAIAQVFAGEGSHGGTERTEGVKR